MPGRYGPRGGERSSKLTRVARHQLRQLVACASVKGGEKGSGAALTTTVALEGGADAPVGGGARTVLPVWWSLVLDGGGECWPSGIGAAPYRLIAAFIS